MSAASADTDSDLLRGRPLYVCEGIADAMGLATWAGATALAILGTSGYKDLKLAADLAALEGGAVVCGDRDSAGRAAQQTLIRAVQWRGGRASAWQIGASFAGAGGGSYDPADWARDCDYERLERLAIEGETKQ